MAEKIATQLVVLLLSFFGTWFALSQINFIDEDPSTGFARENEKKLGELILEAITTTHEKVENEKVRAVIDSIKAKICRTEIIRCEDIKIHIIKSPEINAFALPDNHMVIYTGLIEYAENAEEVAGVMAHEIGHMEKRHVMKKLIKDIGLEMLFAMAGGDAGFEIIRETGKTLSSTAFDRRQETEADVYAVEALAGANIDPQHLSNFFFRLSQKHRFPAELAWVSTHPDAKERAAAIIQMKKKYDYTEADVIGTPWDSVKSLLNDDTSTQNSPQ